MPLAERKWEIASIIAVASSSSARSIRSATPVIKAPSSGEYSSTSSAKACQPAKGKVKRDPPRLETSGPGFASNWHLSYQGDAPKRPRHPLKTLPVNGRSCDPPGLPILTSEFFTEKFSMVSRVLHRH